MRTIRAVHACGRPEGRHRARCVAGRADDADAPGGRRGQPTTDARRRRAIVPGNPAERTEARLALLETHRASLPPTTPIVAHKEGEDGRLLTRLGSAGGEADLSTTPREPHGREALRLQTRKTCEFLADENRHEAVHAHGAPCSYGCKFEAEATVSGTLATSASTVSFKAELVPPALCACGHDAQGDATRRGSAREARSAQATTTRVEASSTRRAAQMARRPHRMRQKVLRDPRTMCRNAASCTRRGATAPAESVKKVELGAQIGIDILEPQRT